jgi:nucleoside-diphosphate-sugar epimerase
VNVFLAGATGAVGPRLSLLLRADGHAVTGTTRSRAKEAQLRSDGVTPVVVNVFDSHALRDAVVRAKPEIVIHQLTDLAGLLEPGRRDEVLTRNARLRIEGTANLVAAAIAVSGLSAPLRVRPQVFGSNARLPTPKA